MTSSADEVIASAEAAIEEIFEVVAPSIGDVFSALVALLAPGLDHGPLPETPAAPTASSAPSAVATSAAPAQGTVPRAHSEATSPPKEQAKPSISAHPEGAPVTSLPLLASPRGASGDVTAAATTLFFGVGGAILLLFLTRAPQGLLTRIDLVSVRWRTVAFVSLLERPG